MNRINGKKYSEILSEIKEQEIYKKPSTYNYDMKNLVSYLKRNHKSYSEVSKQDLNQFGIRG